MNEINKLSFRKNLRIWLLNNPNLNPYKFSFDKMYRRITASFRMLPDFIIIGPGRSGTTSLYNYLTQHPCVGAANRKEIHFFEYITSNNINWYKSHFPTKLYKNYLIMKNKKIFITGEASATYIFHPEIPKRIFNLIPHVKLISILRNPIDRAYSTYNQQVRYGMESQSFEDAIQSETKRIEINKNENELQIKNYDFNNYTAFSYLRNGIYVDFLKVWMQIFGKEQMLVLETKDLDEHTTTTLNQVFDFLNIPSSKILNLEKRNVGKYEKMNESIRKFLMDYYKPHNERLYKLLEKNFDWDK